MRRSVLLIAVGLVALAGSMAVAQSGTTSGSERKIASRVAPTYPELAKKMHIRGIVRLEAVVRTNGSVKSTRVLGGNPVLVASAVEAVEKWKFEPTQNETTEVVQVTFDAQ
jgi:TonB family protein